MGIIINALEDLTKGSENPGSRSFLRRDLDHIEDLEDLIEILF